MNGWLMLGVFLLGGFTFRWGLDLLDLFLQMITNLYNVQMTKLQVKVNNISKEMEPQEEISTTAVGFQMEELAVDMEYEEDYDE